MGFDLETKRECPHCGNQIGGGMGNLKTHIKKCQVKLGIVVEEEVNEINGDKNMSLFVEVQSVDKNCPVIINLEHVVEIAPLAAGGCALFLNDGTGKYDIKVKDEYSMFKQFALETVSAEDIAKKIAKLKG